MFINNFREVLELELMFPVYFHLLRESTFELLNFYFQVLNLDIDPDPCVIFQPV